MHLLLTSHQHHPVIRFENQRRLQDEERSKNFRWEEQHAQQPMIIHYTYLCDPWCCNQSRIERALKNTLSTWAGKISGLSTADWGWRLRSDMNSFIEVCASTSIHVFNGSTTFLCAICQIQLLFFETARRSLLGSFRLQLLGPILRQLFAEERVFLKCVDIRRDVRASCLWRGSSLESSLKFSYQCCANAGLSLSVSSTAWMVDKLFFVPTYSPLDERSPSIGAAFSYRWNWISLDCLIRKLHLPEIKVGEMVVLLLEFFITAMCWVRERSAAFSMQLQVTMFWTHP